MKAKAKQYAQALFAEIKDKKTGDLDKLVNNFFEILKNDNCLSQLEKIIFYFNDLWKKEYSLVEAEITTARSLEADLRQEIISYLAKKSNSSEIKISEKENAKIKGGFIIKYDNKIIDASIKNKINIFKNNLIQ